MHLRLNIAANYAGQVYAGLLGIVLVPFYLGLMGTEAYGLIGFFLLLQAWSQLLDLGMSATMSRETARYLGGGLSATELRRLLRSLEWLFWPMGMLLAAGLIVSAPLIASSWLKLLVLQRSEVEIALVLMAATVAMRWIGGLYRGVVNGLERQVWLNAFNGTIATIRFVAVVPILVMVSATPFYFFLFQAAVSVAELCILIGVCHSLVPLPKGEQVRGSWASLRHLLAFSATIAFATVVWVVVTNVDKLIISTMVPLAEYGYFTAAVMAASAISMVSAAVSQALTPRLTRLSQQSDTTAFVELYRAATQWTAAVVGPLTLSMAIFAEPVLWAWTGDRSFASTSGPVLALYAIGNGLMTLAAFPYCLQYAKGDLRLHLWGNILFAAILIPAVLYATSTYGALGAGWVWAASNAMFFLFWTPFVHHRFLPGIHRAWFMRDVMRVLAFPAALGLAMAFMSPTWALGRIQSSLLVLATGLAMTAGALWMSELARLRLRMLCGRLAARMR